MKTIYYNQKCSKCRIAREYLDKKHIPYKIFEYLSGNLTQDKIKEILKKGNLSSPINILRTKEEEYKTHIKDKELSDEQIINVIIKYPKMLQRPIIVSNNSAIIARDSKTLSKIN